MAPELEAALASIYEEIMWLSVRPNVTAGRARAWYTHIMVESVKLKLRRFTGQVSKQAIASDGKDLRLEHYMRIQTTLTQLVEKHRAENIRNVTEFISTVVEYEQVHIVTTKENYDAMRAKGDYSLAGIELVSWAEISQSRRTELWKKMLRGKVANAVEYQP